MTASLDRHANNVSPPDEEKRLGKRRRHRLRRLSGRLLPKWRVAACGRDHLGPNVTLHRSDCGHHFGGLETCGSVWTCPVCAAKITEGRCAEIEAVLKAHHEAGGRAYMMTLTIPHAAMQTCQELLDTVRGVWRWVKTGSPWCRAKERSGYLGDVRALEVTHGANGWHPHLHVLVFLQPGTTDEQATYLAHWFYERWARGVEGRGYGDCSAGAFTFKPVTEDYGAAQYVGKWGAALELTKAHTKRSRGGRTPWQILEDCQNGNPRDAALFRDYAKTFKGARQLTWAGSVRKAYCPEPEAPDEALAEAPTLPETQIATLDGKLWTYVLHYDLTADVLLAADGGGVHAVVDLLRKIGVPFEISIRHSLERDRMVPWIEWRPPK